MSRFISIRTVIIVISSAFFSCGLFRNSQNTKKSSYTQTPFAGRYFQLDSTIFRYKGEKIKQLDGFIRDSSGRILSYYSISGKCGCISKSVLVNERLSRKSLYSLTSELLPNIIPVSKEDSFVFRKFLEYPGINNYCASKMLETAKGFLPSEKE